MNKIVCEPYPSFSSNVHFVYQVSLGKFLFVNPDILAFVGMNNCDFETFAKFVVKDDWPVLKKAYQDLLSDRFNGSIKFRMEGNGRQRWFSVTPFIYHEQDEKLVCGSLIDISGEVENIDAVKKYANKKNSILHMLAHDLRGPLSIANSLVKTIDSGDTNPGALLKTASISSILKQAIELIENLTEREFLDATEVALVKQRFDVVQKLQDYIDECRRSAALANRSFEFKKPDYPILLELDESKFMQVVNNLISNALKFTHDGGNLCISITEEQDAVNLIFDDDGIGIPPDLMPHIFDEYTKAGRLGLNGEKSTGLGLSIVKTIINWHRGTIQCQSEEGKGSRFLVKFPK